MEVAGEVTDCVLGFFFTVLAVSVIVFLADQVDVCLLEHQWFISFTGDFKLLNRLYSMLVQWPRSSFHLFLAMKHHAFRS